MVIAVWGKLIYSKTVTISQGPKKRVRREPEPTNQLGFKNGKPPPPRFINFTLGGGHPSPKSLGKKEGLLPLLNFLNRGRTTEVLHRVPPSQRNIPPSTKKNVPRSFLRNQNRKTRRRRHDQYLERGKKVIQTEPVEKKWTRTLDLTGLIG